MPANAVNAIKAASDAALAGNGNRCKRKYGKMVNSPRTSALNTACAAMTRMLMLSSFRRWMKSAVKMVQGAIEGRMYPGSFDCEMEKNRIGRRLQMTRNSG